MSPPKLIIETEEERMILTDEQRSQVRKSAALTPPATKSATKTSHLLSYIVFFQLNKFPS